MQAALQVRIVSISQWLTDASGARAFRLARALRSRGCHVELWTSAWDHIGKRWRASDGQIAQVDDVQVRFLGGCGYRRNIGLARWIDHQLLARAYKTKSGTAPAPDIVIACIPDHNVAAAAVMEGERRGYPVLIDVLDKWPDLIVERFEHSVARLPVSAILAGDIARMRRTVRGAASVVTIMPAFRNWLQRRYDRNARNDRVFPLATSDIRPLPVRTEQTGFRLVFAGTLNQTQFPQTLLDAAALLAEDGNCALRFQIAGDGEGRERLMRRARKLPNVEYLGWLDQRRLAALLDQAHLGAIVTNGSFEIFNHKLFAYLAHGLGIVSTASGDAAEMIEAEQAGINVPPQNARALADALHQLTRTPDAIRAMGARAHALHARCFDPNQIYGAYADHVVAIAASTRAPSAVERRL